MYLAHIIFCCFRALAYATLDRQVQFFFYVIFAVLIQSVGRRDIRNLEHRQIALTGEL